MDRKIAGLDEASEMLQINVVLVWDRFLAKTGRRSETASIHTTSTNDSHQGVVSSLGRKFHKPDLKCLCLSSALCFGLQDRKLRWGKDMHLFRDVTSIFMFSKVGRSVRSIARGRGPSTKLAHIMVGWLLCASGK